MNNKKYYTVVVSNEEGYMLRATTWDTVDKLGTFSSGNYNYSITNKESHLVSVGSGSDSRLSQGLIKIDEEYANKILRDYVKSRSKYE